LGLTPQPAAERRGFRLPFAARFQGLLILIMFAGLFLIGQQWDKRLYQIGLPVLVIAAFLQIAFGNIPPRSNWKQSMLLLALTWIIVAAVFVLAVKLAPTMIERSR
jgi:hypothetical protein